MDTPNYGLLRQVEMPSILDSRTKAANLSGMAMNQARGEKMMAREDQEAKHMEHLRKASVFGNALESLSGLPPQERAAAYPQLRHELVRDGVLGEQDAPSEYDDTYYNGSLRKFRQSKEGIDQRLKNAQIAKLEREAAGGGLAKLTKGQEAVDREYGKSYAKEVMGGGANSAKNLSQLKSVSEKLGNTNMATGPIIGNLPFRDTLMPGSKAIQEEVEEVVQGSLREALGAAYTEKEGRDLLARTYNPRLDEAENKKRVDRLIKRIEVANKMKQEANSYFQQNGTLSGYKGQMPTWEMFEGIGEEEQRGGSATAYASEPPKPGTEDGGFVYMGGDPSNPKSWKKAR